MSFPQVQNFQNNVIISFVQKWLDDSSFDSFIKEAMGDFEVKFFRPGEKINIFNFIEEKDHDITPSEFWKEIERFVKMDRGSKREVVKKLMEYSKIAYSATDCRDYARVDYRVSGDEIYLLEVNYNPGIGPNTHGLNNTLTMMASFEGYSFEDLVEKIIKTAAKRCGIRIGMTVKSHSFAII